MRTALAVALAVASGSAAALGLGQIELKSKLGEPLLAEIRIISSDPSELEHLRAGLASPETFARIGLQPPQGVIANLQFLPALDDAGNPVIRVTSAMPIDEPLLTFLIEVDWGQGRLVREYSTLLDAPRTVSAPLQPPIDAPLVAPSNAIVREAQPASPQGGRDADEASEPADDRVADLDADRATTPGTTVPTAAGAMPGTPVPAGRPDRYGAVQRGESLSQIARQLHRGGNLDQTMIALLQANPDAFIDGNIHLLKQGAVLRVPDADAVNAVQAAQAMAQVREQTRAWRAARQPVPQPQLAGADIDSDPASDPNASAAATATGSDGARLEIVPPGASDATRAGTQSGISAGGEGDMVRQELQTTKETLAARDAELAEMKSRIDALEKLQADQQKLISMKDAELTAAQQQLAQTQATGTADRGSSTPWLLGGTGLLAALLLGGWWLRRRAELAPKFRAPTPATEPGQRASSSLAAGFPGAASASGPEPEAAMAESTAVMAETRLNDSMPLPAGQPAQAETIDADSSVDQRVDQHRDQDRDRVAVPAWHATSGKNKLNRPEPTSSPAPAPAVPAAASTTFDTDAPGMERLELARAYLELGDRESARQLLGELVVNGNLDARQQAARLLREIE